jgi:mannose-1-phosphate guanylyltransferase
MQYTEKPWGYEKLHECNRFYAVKEIFLKKGARCSLQSHAKKQETSVVVAGSLEVEIAGANGVLQKKSYQVGESYSVSPGTIHRVTALEDSTIIETSTPELDDVIRHADDYGRNTSFRE